MNEPRTDNVLRLPDGRMLGYAEYGDPGGTPVMLFHGLPGSRLTARVGHIIAAERGVRLVAPDGQQVGITPLPEALQMARDLDLDLVEVAPLANPPVCRIMDYGKYKYEEAQRARESRRKSSAVAIKEIPLRTSNEAPVPTQAIGAGTPDGAGTGAASPPVRPAPSAD